MTRRVALLPLLLAACGGLEKPDLESATVTGRIVAARTDGVLSAPPCAQPALSCPAAYAYPLGRPDLKVDVASDGSFELEGVPVSTTAIVLFDGVGRAELAPLAVQGAMVNKLDDRYGENAAPPSGAAKMPLASVLVAGVKIDCGANVRGPQFALRETDHLRETPPPSGAAAAIWPVPKGSYDLSAVMSGFKEGLAHVAVPDGATVTADVQMDVDTGDVEPGCSATGGCQNPSLSCDTSDGYCYECWEDHGCTAPYQCNLETHTCVQPSGSGHACAACTTDLDCGGGTNKCLTGGMGMGYCTRQPCSGNGDCPSGFACNNQICTVPVGSSCTAYTETFGAPCVEDETCRSALADGHCRSDSSYSGYCTSRCSTDADCPASLGFATCSSGYCQRSY
jgi:hypothetical protein